MACVERQAGKGPWNETVALESSVCFLPYLFTHFTLYFLREFLFKICKVEDGEEEQGQGKGLKNKVLMMTNLLWGTRTLWQRYRLVAVGGTGC